MEPSCTQIEICDGCYVLVCTFFIGANMLTFSPCTTHSRVDRAARQQPGTHDTILRSKAQQQWRVTTDGVWTWPLSRTRPTVFDLLDISLFDPQDTRVRCSG